MNLIYMIYIYIYIYIPESSQGLKFVPLNHQKQKVDTFGAMTGATFRTLQTLKRPRMRYWLIQADFSLLSVTWPIALKKPLWHDQLGPPPPCVRYWEIEGESEAPPKMDIL